MIPGPFLNSLKIYLETSVVVIHSIVKNTVTTSNALLNSIHRARFGWNWGRSRFANDKTCLTDPV